MSMNLYVRKNPAKTDNLCLGHSLRNIIAEEEGNISFKWRQVRISRDFLCGLVAAKVDGAERLLEFWDEHDGDVEFEIA